MTTELRGGSDVALLLPRLNWNAFKLGKPRPTSPCLHSTAVNNGRREHWKQRSSPEPHSAHVNHCIAVPVYPHTWTLGKEDGPKRVTSVTLQRKNELRVFPGVQDSSKGCFPYGEHYPSRGAILMELGSLLEEPTMSSIFLTMVSTLPFLRANWGSKTTTVLKTGNPPPDQFA